MISENIKIRIILLIAGSFLGVVFGVAISYIWYVFCALILGWGDSAPDWYFKIQNTLQTTVMLISIIIGILGLQLLYKKAQNKRKGMSQEIHPVDSK